MMSNQKTSGNPATFGKAVKSLGKQPVFLIAAGVLLLAAVSLNAATRFLKLHFKKLPVPLARTLEDIPMHVGSKWVCVVREEVSDEVEQELGTQLYVMRLYVNKDEVSKAELAQFEGKTPKQCQLELSKLKTLHHGKLDPAIISLAVTYYTGKADTVAHIPERCYTADGYEPVATETETWDLKDKQTPDGNIAFRYISFEDQVNAGAPVKRNVAYTFHVNGAYNSDPTRVRMSLQNLFERYGYYAKVEVMVQDPDRNVARKTMQDFLTAAMPEVERCLPDWNAVTKR